MITQEDFNTRESNNASISAAQTFKKQRCVLLAEDDRSLRRYLEVVLRRAGYNVLAAADGLEAIIVTDAIMPNLNGYELCRFVRNTPQLSHLPIVLLSALEQKESRPEDRQADVYLLKPISPEDLVARLESLLPQPV